MRKLHLLLFVSSLVGSVVAAACGSTSESAFTNGNGSDGGGGGASSSGSFPQGDGGGNETPGTQPIAIEPLDRVLDFVTGSPAPTVQYLAKIVTTGQTVPAVFAIDRGEIGLVGAQSGLFTASGTAGGKARITATWNGNTASTTVTVKLKIRENGGVANADAGGGSGGNGGVGGNGPGPAVDAAVSGVLHQTPTADANLSLLYPYDATVWPRGILAPLLMWKSAGNYEALLIKIQGANIDYEGTYGRNATTFQNHPISQAAWKQMLTSNEGEDVNVTLTFARGGVAYGPLTVKWKVASAPLKGVVYYNSYGTRLAKNFDGALPEPKTKFGGATLGIRGGSTDPFLVAGGDGDRTYCRVCHSVAANGSVLITQRDTGEKRLFSTYDLKANVETPMTNVASNADGDAKYSWTAIYPDGSIFLGDSSSAEGSSNKPNQLYETVSGGALKTPNPLPMNGWPSGFRAAFPAFSPDGKNLVFSKFAGAEGADKRTLAYMSFDKGSSTFGTMQELHRPANGAHYAIYPAFLPTNDAVVYSLVTRQNTRGTGYGETRADNDGSNLVGARAELWWVNAKAGSTPTPVRLDKLNGVGYLPTGPKGHDDDASLNYEPTVNPVPSGGYAWVVFTSRRLYGNVATIEPYASDPRYTDISKDPTTKKLWVAAIDLNAAPGTDPSHPAFYLPAQELLAGNSRGYWVVDPCRTDGDGCETGDECCGGFCRPDAQNKLVCSNVVPTCAQEFEKCSVASDCCNSAAINCINGRCAVPAPR